MGRHRSGQIAACRASNRVCPKTIRSSACWTAGGCCDVSALKRPWPALAGQSIGLERSGCSLSERHPLPPYPTVALAGTPLNFS